MEAMRKFGLVLPIMALFVLCFSIVLCTWLKVDVSKKQSQLQQLQAQVDAISRENENINYLINEADEKELYEHLARERGYVYPDEKVYYDVTPGN